MNINTLRHPKEKLYRTICMVVGGLVWAGLLLGTAFSILGFLIPIAIVLWLSEKFFQASIYGNSVMVSENQYSKVHELVKNTAKDRSSLKLSIFMPVYTSPLKVEIACLEFWVVKGIYQS